MTLPKQKAVLSVALLLHASVAVSLSRTETTGGSFITRPAVDMPLVDTPAAPIIDSSSLMAVPSIQLQSSVSAYVKRFIKTNREDLQAAARRGQTLFRQMAPAFKAEGLPTELMYLAVVESGLKPQARSRVGAVGLWQLMGETARDLGLVVKARTDERKSVRRSTQVAARYLKSLYAVYNDWLLVVAAYNSGPGVVNKAIRKSGSRNYWALQRFLPAETRGHVKRYIAVHFYFENAGGETTLTRSERLAHEKRTAEQMTKAVAVKKAAVQPDAVAVNEGVELRKR